MITSRDINFVGGPPPLSDSGYQIRAIAYFVRDMKLFRFWILTVAIAFAITGCSTINVRQSESEKHAPQPEFFTFKDGGEALYYMFETGTPISPETLIFFVSGSGCASVKSRLPTFFDPMRDVGVRVFALQKRGISENSGGFVCSEVFEAADYFERILSDQQEFIAKKLATYATKPRAVILIGASEGAVVAAKLASLDSRITHLGLIGSGGSTLREDLRILSERTWYLSSPEETYRWIADDADNLAKSVWGHSYKYWSSMLDVNIGDILLALEIPIVLVMGQDDESVPTDTAVGLKKRFDQQKKHNLIFHIYPGADHRLMSHDKTKSYSRNFLEEISRTLRLVSPP